MTTPDSGLLFWATLYSFNNYSTSLYGYWVWIAYAL